MRLKRCAADSKHSFLHAEITWITNFSTSIIVIYMYHSSHDTVTTEDIFTVLNRSHLFEISAGPVFYVNWEMTKNNQTHESQQHKIRWLFLDQLLDQYSFYTFTPLSIRIFKMYAVQKCWHRGKWQ